MTKKIQELLKSADIEIDGSRPWDIQVHDRRWYRRIFQDRNLGLGESYMEGWWDCRRIDEMIFRLLRKGLDSQVRGGFKHLLHFLPALLLNLQSRARSRMIAERHYDLDNDLFFSFLDSYHQYSCGYFKETNDLEEAQRQKMELIARKLELSSRDHLLDVGSGWGGLARFAAEVHHCRVTGINISTPQLDYARESCRDLPVEFQDCDYRQITGSFEKIVSVGMFEHVGRKNYRKFMEVLNRSLQDQGLLLLHTIGGNLSRVNCDPWINRYIFPNGMLPSLKQIARAAEGLFIIEDLQNLGTHYDRTLLSWNSNFQKAWPQLSARYDQRFKRMWEYYLLSCAGAFRARGIQVWQVLMSKFGSGTMTPRHCRT